MVQIKTEITEDARLTLYKVSINEKKRLKRHVTVGQAISIMAKKFEEYEQLKTKENGKV